MSQSKEPLKTTQLTCANCGHSEPNMSRWMSMISFKCLLCFSITELKPSESPSPTADSKKKKSAEKG